MNSRPKLAVVTQAKAKVASVLDQAKTYSDGKEKGEHGECLPEILSGSVWPKLGKRREERPQVRGKRSWSPDEKHSIAN